MIRQANETDLKGIIDIYNDAILNTTAVYTYKPYNMSYARKWYEEKKEKGYPVLVFEECNKIIGFATFGQFRSWPAYKYSIEHSIYVSKDYRRRKIASKLMKKLIEIADKEEYAVIIAGIDSSNKESIEFHKKIGFNYSGTIKKAGFKFGKWLDLDFYQFNLTGPKFPIEE